MARPSSSTIERHHFELFRKDYSLPEGEVIYTDRPDVIVQANLTLGIEITNLYIVPGSNPASEQVQKRRREKVLELAQAQYLAEGGKDFELSVDFNPLKPIEKLEPLVRNLVSLAHQLKNVETGQVSSLLFENIEELRFAYLYAKECTDPKWRLIQGYDVPILSIERLREIVLEKTAKLAEYQKCDRYWLLIVVDLMDPAQDQELRWPSEAELTKTCYEKVLLYKPQYRQVLEVPVTTNNLLHQTAFSGR